MAANYLQGDDYWSMPDGTQLYAPGALQGKRAMAASLMRNQRENKNAGDGIYNATNSIFSAILMAQADKAEKAALTQRTEGGRLEAGSILTPGQEGRQTSFAMPGDTDMRGATPGTPMVGSAWDAAIDKHVPEDMRPYFRALYKGEGGTTGAKSSTGAWGGPQWLKSTGEQYGLVGKDFDYRNDPERSTLAAVQFTNDNRAALAKALGRDPTWAETALAHQQGAGGARALLTNPNARAGDVIDPYKLQVNRIDPNLTAGQAAQQIMQYYKMPQGGGQQYAMVGQQQPGLPVAQGVQALGGQTGSGITPDMIAFAKWAKANPTIASPDQLQRADKIMEQAINPGEWQNLGGGYFRTKSGQIMFVNQGVQKTQEGEIGYTVGPNGQVTYINGQGQGGGKYDKPGYAPDGTFGRSREQMAISERDLKQRGDDLAQSVHAANYAAKLETLEDQLLSINWRGPAAELVQPIRSFLVSLGVRDPDAVAAQGLEGVRAALSDTIKQAFDQKMITQYEFQNASKGLLPGLGTNTGAEKAIMDILHNANTRQRALGSLANAYDNNMLGTGAQAEARYRELRQLIINDTAIGQNYKQNPNTGEVRYYDPRSRGSHSYTFSQGYQR